MKKRAKWKGPNIYPRLSNNNSLENKKYKILKIKRNSEITPQYVGLDFKVHTGKTFLVLTVTKEMIGNKFGEFVPTRSNFVFKKGKNKL